MADDPHAVHDDFVVEHTEPTPEPDDILSEETAHAEPAGPHDRASLEPSPPAPAAPPQPQIPAPPQLEVPLDPAAQRREQQRRHDLRQRVKMCKWFSLVTGVLIVGIAVWVYTHQDSEALAVGITTGVVLLILFAILSYVAWGMKFDMPCDYCHGRGTVWVVDEFNTTHYQFCLRCHGRGRLN